MTSLLLNNSLSLEQLYESKSLSNDADFLFFLRDWYLSIATFDEKTGETLSTDLESFLFNVSKYKGDKNQQDYISRITSHSKEALKYIFQNPREKILREHAIVPIYAAREVDSKSVEWLSRRSGRNLREKLAEKPYIKAVTRRFSLDTIENRLIKAFVYRLEGLLYLRENLEFKDSSDLLQNIERWLHFDDVKEVGSWSNLPPNNTLLQNKYYRKIWDSWIWIQEIDDLVVEDVRKYKNNFLHTIVWTLISELNGYDEVRLLQQPIFLDYDNFDIKVTKRVEGIVYTPEKQQQVFCEYQNNKVKISVENKILFMCEIDKSEHLKVIINNQREEYDYSRKSLIEMQKKFVSLLNKNYKFSKRKSSNRKDYSSKKVILDLDLIYPKFIIDDKEEIFSSRYVTQYWQSKDELIDVDCSCAKGIFINKNIVTLSMKNLFSKDILEKDDGSLVIKTLNNFTKEMANSLKVDELTYLVSDRVDEFSSERLRRSLNYAFNDTTPLPRSIASVFYFQSAKGFKKLKFNRDDMVIVIEVSSEAISATKLIAKFDQKLKNILPSTDGIVWERHPSVDIKGTLPRKTLEKYLGETASLKTIIDVWGKNGLEQDSSKLSWKVDDKWFHNDKKYKDDIIDIQWKQVKSQLNIRNNSRLEIIVIGEYANQVRIIGQESINLDYNLLEGANTLSKWQSQVEEIALWRDHLPNLSFNIPQDGRYTDFYLVKDTTIVPRKGKVSKIKIDKPLTLPKNRTFYEFPLTLGSGSQELKFMASLRSSVLPLSEDVVCNLIMTYTYGADDPYELYFVPKNEEDKELFKAIRVEWKDLSKREKIDAPIPDFPKRYSWKDFEKNHNKKTNKYSNLFEWIEQDINKIISLDKFISGDIKYLTGKRTFIDMSNIEWKQAANGDYFCRYLLPHNKEVFIHQDEYEKFNINYEKISFDLKDNHGGLVAINITKGKSIVNSFEFVNKLRKSMRFPVITVWNQGHSLSEIDAPKDFRVIVQRGIDSAISLLKEQELNIKIKEELQYLLSILHKDMPVEVSSYLLSQSDTKNIKQKDNAKMIAYAIGDASLDWQKQLLDNAINSSERIVILSIALWRSEVLIYSLSKKQLQIIIDDILEFKFAKDKKNIFLLTQKLEVLLSLLRIRGSDDSDLKAIFEIDSVINKKLIQIVEKLTDKILEQNIYIKTRITFNLNKPKTLNKTHDLLYALRLYLTGEDGANSIEVAEVESE